MPAIVDRDACGNIRLQRHAVAHFLLRLGDVRGEVELGIGQRLAEKFFNQPVIPFIGHRLVPLVADAENIEDEVVGARVDVGAQDVDACG